MKNDAYVPELITTTDRLEQLAAGLIHSDAIAVDTEFFWERTFYPILGLVQLASREGCWLIDTVRIHDIRALGPILAAPSITKILHDAPQDLGILARATGAAPRTVFDTRLAAGFAGFSSTCSLQSLLHDALTIDLPKSETRSNWLRRPLTPNQLSYAADDVLHLLALRETLLGRCADDTVRGWLAEELARMDDPSLYGDRNPRNMYLRVKGWARLIPRQLALLRELADWREHEARKRDWPRAHILPDDLLVALALRAPADTTAFNDIQGLPRNMPADVVVDVLAAVRCGLSIPDNACPEPATALDLTAKRELKPKSDRLLAHITAACEPYRIDPALVASRTDADAYIQSIITQGNADGHPLAQGWRKTFVTDFIP